MKLELDIEIEKTNCILHDVCRRVFVGKMPKKCYDNLLARKECMFLKEELRRKKKNG